MDIRFAEVVEALNDFKILFAFGAVVSENPSGYKPNLPSKLKKVCQDAEEVLATVEMLANNERIHTAEGIILDWSERLKKSLDKIRALTGDDGEWHQKLGRCWNEVPLPPCVEQFFIAYVNSLKGRYPGLLGVERKGMNLPMNARGISYYDLSDLTVCFADRVAQEKFDAENTVEPCVHMVWNGAGWVSY